MDIEFHYYMTHLIALRAGFKPDDALTVAYASQYTDDNQTSYQIKGADVPYENLISQTVDITKPKEKHLRIYPAFHFCPGTRTEVFRLSPSRRDGKFHLLATIPNNKNARTIFDKALKSGDLYRIGIGTHMYADTFCHRDFAGWKDEFNWTRLDGFAGGLWSALGPAIGHALAMHCPDIPPLVWEDIRLTSRYREKKNKEQILSAAGNIWDFFCLNTKPAKTSAIKKRLLGDLDSAIGEEVKEDTGILRKKRLENYKVLLGSEYKEYDKEHWFDAAVDRRIVAATIGTSDVRYTCSWKDAHLKSDWYAFQEAVKAHQAAAFNVLGKIFKVIEIEMT